MGVPASAAVCYGAAMVIHMIISSNTIDDTELFTTAAALIGDSLKSSCGFSPAPEDLLFFDIETTGLKAEYSYLYMIGCLYLEDGVPREVQFFSEALNEEYDLIDSFDRILAGHKVLVHFNGQTFDIPYLERKRQMLALPSPADFISFDIFRELHPLRKFFGLSSMSQKSLELFCGLRRKDIYDGGQLIEFYNHYIAYKRLEDLKGGNCHSDSDELLKCLLLHNREDVLGMLTVVGLLSVVQLLNGSFDIAECITLESFPYDSAANSGIELTFDDRCFGVERYFTQPLMLYSGSVCCGCLHANDGKLHAILPVYSAELKYFYPNYRDYYYLPAEDSCIHKSVGEFLDRELRVKCSAANCYVKNSGMFIPLKPDLQKLRKQHPDLEFKLFRHEYGDRLVFVQVNEFLNSPRTVIRLMFE